MAVVPRRHLDRISDAGATELADIFRLVGEVQDLLRSDHPSGRLRTSIEGETGIDGEARAFILVAVVDGPDGWSVQVAPAGPASPARLVDSLDGRVLMPELVRCLEDPRYRLVDILVSFIMKSGTRLLGPYLADCVQRGAQVRILATDYGHITDADALAWLLDLQESAGAGGDEPGRFEVRMFSDPMTSFHPKAYLFASSDGAERIAFVGSNNLSESGLNGGVEWALAVQDAGELVESFNHLWNDARVRPLDHEWLRSYRSRWEPAATLATAAGHAVPAVVDPEDAEPVAPAQPRPLQVEALEALAATRAAGHSAGVVVMATGLGKTWLAAFDSRRPGFGRVLFIAHREEILQQSRDVYRRVDPGAELGLFVGGQRQADADVVFASIQLLGNRFQEFAPDAFDYIVVDEFHHSTASTYRRILDYFRPRFLLGITATPVRMDGDDPLELCGGNLVFECDLIEGIDRGELVPFRYWGIKDIAEYENIPWRNGRFDPVLLEQAIETQDRAQQALDEWTARCGDRTVAFCASIHHAEFMCRFFRERGVRCEVVHSGTGRVRRSRIREEIDRGDLQVVFAVDLYNEGVDLPAVDSVLMLRPTESRTIFLQQLGRGLRLSAGKDFLRVVDFVGNHHSFLLKPRIFMELAGAGVGAAVTTGELREVLGTQEFALPAGCSVEFEGEAVDLLARMAAARMSQADLLADYCRSTTEETGVRPTARQAASHGFDLSGAHRQHGGWFGFLEHLDLLDNAESDAWATSGDTIAEFERMAVTKSLKLVTVKALLAEGALRAPVEVDTLVERAKRIVLADPRLVDDCTNPSRLPDPRTASTPAWRAYWETYPLKALVNGVNPLFGRTGDRLQPTFDVPESVGAVFDAMVAEVVEWRLQTYLATRVSSIEEKCQVVSRAGVPVIDLPPRLRARVPSEVFPVHTPMTEAMATRVRGGIRLRSHEGLDVLLDWFGPTAGHDGTADEVLVRLDDAWTVTPVAANDDVVRLAAGDSTTQFEAWNGGAELPGLVELFRPLSPIDPASMALLLAGSDMAIGDVELQRGDAALVSRSGGPLPELVRVVDPAERNPIAEHVGRTLQRADVPLLFGEEFNTGKWNSGVVPVGDQDLVLFVTLAKTSAMATGREYEDYFETSDVMHWTSQTNTTRESKRGRAILGACTNGTRLHLLVRPKKREPFVYYGLAVPLRHQGSNPIQVWFRLLTPPVDTPPDAPPAA